MSKLIKFVVFFGIVLIHGITYADDSVTTTAVCCYGVTKQQCCEQNGGVWCGIDESCHKQHSVSLWDSPCMNRQICEEQLYGSWCGDEPAKCYRDYWDWRVSGCSDVTPADCPGSKFKWCESDNHCYYNTVVREPRYSTHCH